MLGAEDRGGSADASALIALVQAPRRPPPHYADLLEHGRTAVDLLEEDHGLLASELIAAAEKDLAGWKAQGIAVLTVLDAEYPDNLRAVHDRPPLIFVRGTLTPADGRAVGVIGSRQASASGLARAGAVSEALIAGGYTVVSGLALGIDTAAHTTALERQGRTLAVVGTGVNQCYPRENAPLQRRIAFEGAVISQFLPDQGPRRDNFPLRNALISGLSLATVIVEAGLKSGARILARQALHHGRPLLLDGAVLEQEWAQQLAGRPGTHVVRSPSDVVEVVERLSSSQAPAG